MGNTETVIKKSHLVSQKYGMDNQGINFARKMQSFYQIHIKNNCSLHQHLCIYTTGNGLHGEISVYINVFGLSLLLISSIMLNEEKKILKFQQTNSLFQAIIHDHKRAIIRMTSGQNWNYGGLVK